MGTSRASSKNIVELIREGVNVILANAPEDIPTLVAYYNQEPEPWPDDRPSEEHPAGIMLQESLRKIGNAQDGKLGSSNVAVEHDKYLAEIFVAKHQA